MQCNVALNECFQFQPNLKYLTQKAAGEGSEKDYDKSHESFNPFTRHQAPRLRLWNYGKWIYLAMTHGFK